MPNKHSAIKSMRKDKTRSNRNSLVKQNLDFQRRAFRKAVEAKDLKKAAEFAAKIIRATDKAVQNKVLKLNTGSRIKSRTCATLKRASAK